MRQLHLASGTWQYKVGRSDILLFDPGGAKHVIDIRALCPYIERGRWKITDDGMVTPGKLKEYIVSHLCSTEGRS